MAAVTSSDVTLVTWWDVKPLGDHNVIHHRVLDITISSNGGTADDIPASVLGFATNGILWAQTLQHTVSGPTYHCVPVIVQNDKNGILTINLEDSTDNTRSDPANPHANGTLRVLVAGYRSN